MTSAEIESSFWTHYIMLEKEFMSTTGYVRIDSDNYNTYSDAYAKLLLQIGSEVDVVAKETCKLINPTFSGETMDKYRSILGSDADFLNTKVSLINYGFAIDPWNDIETKTTSQPPSLIWWKAYNKVKHDRTKTVTIDGIVKASYKFANLKNVLSALGGLYQLLLHAYHLAKNNESQRTEVLLPGSRLFKLDGSIWQNTVFPFDTSFDIVNGCLMVRTSTIPY